MADDKPCISELFENDVLDMELVGKIAHNELDKQKGFPFSSVSANSIRALASEYIDSYTNDLGIIEAYAAELDSQLSVEDYRGGKISPEFMLGCAIGLGAASHANADIDYFCDKFSSRAVIEIEELSLPTLRSECRTADDFSLAGVNPDTKFPIGFVSVRDVVDAVDEFGSEHMKETLAPADMERVASSLAEAEQCIVRMSSPTASPSTPSSRWRKSIANRMSRVLMISAKRRAKRPNLSRVARWTNAKFPTTNKTSSQGV